GRALIRSNVRVIAATHQDLDAKVQRGEFRADLMHRLDVVRIHLPALRERREDIAELAQHFLGQAARDFKQPEKSFAPAALQTLMKSDFPGNVRQLENLCRKFAVIAPGSRIQREDLQAQATVSTDRASDAPEWETALRVWVERHLAESHGELHAHARQRFERVLFDAALAIHGGHRQKAAAALGLGRNTLTRKLGSSRKGRGT
ncbi:MAG: helix-turn-helix domain-containing protein, partial [Rhodanobacteraceae bacterium]